MFYFGVHDYTLHKLYIEFEFYLCGKVFFTIIKNISLTIFILDNYNDL